MFRGRRQASGFAIWLLVAEILRMGIENIPPVTLSAVILQAAIFLRLLPIQYLPSVSNVCISAVNVWYRKEWSRLILGALWHLDEWHLYYNMASFLWKGRTLERRYGSSYFFCLLVVFTFLVSTVSVGLAFILAELNDDMSYLTQCAAGFSGVIFALKVITSELLPSNVNVMGIHIPARWACWVELFLIQLLVPNASFIGHLAGIIVGLLYTKGPIQYILQFLFDVVSNLGYRIDQPRRFNGHGSTGQYAHNESSFSQQFSSFPSQQFARGNERNNVRQHWANRYNGDSEHRQNTYNTHAYTGGLSEEEQMAEALRASMADRERRA